MAEAVKAGITVGAVIALKQSPLWEEIRERLQKLYQVGLSKLDTPGEFNQGYYVAAKKYEDTLNALPEILISELEKK